MINLQPRDRLATASRWGLSFGSNRPLTAATAANLKCTAVASRLYEQEPGEAEVSARFGSYLRRWVRWARGGVPREGLCEIAGGSLGQLFP